MEPLYIIEATTTKKDFQKQYFYVNKTVLLIMRIWFTILTVYGLYVFIYLQHVKNFILLLFSCLFLIYAFFYPRYIGHKWEKRTRYKYNQDYLTFRTEFYEDHFRSINIESNSTNDTSYNKIKRIVETKSEIIIILQHKIDDYFIFKSVCANSQELLSFLSSKVGSAL